MRRRAEVPADEAGLARGAFDALPTQTAVLDAEGVILRTNDAWERFGSENGLQDPTSVGCNYLDVCDRTDDEDASAVVAGLRDVLDADRDVFTYEYPCHDPDGEQRWFQLRALTFDAGEHLLVMHFDITERKLAEIELREYTDELELLTGILAHDIRNPLNAAQMRASLLDADGDDAENVAALVRSLDRIDAMIDDALVLAQGNEPTDVRAVDLDVCSDTAWQHVETASATLEIGSLPVIVADEQLLLQLLENLFVNAVDHGGDDVTISVEPIASPDDGEITGFAVADDGPGIDPAAAESVFEAGYTTAPDTGTGYGLAIVEKVASVHGWTVDVTDDDGARFEITGVTRATLGESE
ncbi:ATP-binding protein [Halorientalis brevis]|uniref:histidine kinase n=1 Tax=Halorientalis brevis TaxID=1126241 RepID=A0ABD6C7H4_9EURY|nr:PAS domain-containing sensor histidine kinase [Halorientalis brevis]